MIWNLILIGFGVVIGMQIRHFWNTYGRRTCLVETPEKLDALVEIFDKYGVPVHNSWEGTEGYREVRLRGGLILFCKATTQPRTPMPTIGITSQRPQHTAEALANDLRDAGFDVRNVITTPSVPKGRSKTVVSNALIGTQITVHLPQLNWPRNIKWYQWLASRVQQLASRFR